ncbi:hypothetical protein NW759_017443 [Fusarium solani]|nr:hypothetical protein NW759_017443 [Fusarium solani]
MFALRTHCRVSKFFPASIFKTVNSFVKPCRASIIAPVQRRNIWLIDTETFKLKDFPYPPSDYAILSHTWEDDEVQFQDIKDLEHARSKAGWSKIEMTCYQARQDGLPWAWVDTCCIDKSSSAELSEAINSMFRWYQQASVCYVYLSDLSVNHTWADIPLIKFKMLTVAEEEMLSERLEACRWFTRGWTLQELIAPRRVEFFDQEWYPVGSKTHLGLLNILRDITGIPTDVLRYYRHINDIPIAQTMSWAAWRETTREEDIAYCLLGIFDVNMPLLYGEGMQAFFRLQEAIAKKHYDLSLFTWQQDPAVYGQLRGLFAKSPAEFAHFSELKIANVSREAQSELNLANSLFAVESDLAVTSKTLTMEGRLISPEEIIDRPGHDGADYILDLGFEYYVGSQRERLGIFLAKSIDNKTYIRCRPHELAKWTDPATKGDRKQISIKKDVSRIESYAMGHYSSPLIQFSFSPELDGILDTLNGQSADGYKGWHFEDTESAAHKAGTLTWVSTFTLHITPQTTVRLVAVSGLQWAQQDSNVTADGSRAKTHSHEYWVALFGDGEAHSITETLGMTGGMAGLSGHQESVDGTDATSNEAMKLMEDYHKMAAVHKAAVLRDLVLDTYADEKGYLDQSKLPRLLRIPSRSHGGSICDVWVEAVSKSGVYFVLVKTARRMAGPLPNTERRTYN